MLALDNFKVSPRGPEHEGVPEWVRRVLQSHDRNLDVIFYRWWAGSNQTPGEAAQGRFLVVVRRQPRQYALAKPIIADGQLNFNDWGIVEVVEDRLGGMKVPDRATVESVLKSDRKHTDPKRWLRETRERADRAKALRRQQRTEERRLAMFRAANADLSGKVQVLVPGMVGA